MKGGFLRILIWWFGEHWPICCSIVVENTALLMGTYRITLLAHKSPNLANISGCLVATVVVFPLNTALVDVTISF